MNRVILIGNVGADAELKHTHGGQAVVTIRLCTTERWTGKDGKKQERSEWHTCEWWGKGAEAVCKYIEKGKRIAVEGKIRTDSWEKDGVKQYKTKIAVDNVELLSSNNGGNRGRTEDGASYDRSTGEVDDDIPF